MNSVRGGPVRATNAIDTTMFSQKNALSSSNSQQKTSLAGNAATIQRPSSSKPILEKTANDSESQLSKEKPKNRPASPGAKLMGGTLGSKGKRISLTKQV